MVTVRSQGQSPLLTGWVTGLVRMPNLLAVVTELSTTPFSSTHQPGAAGTSRGDDCEPGRSKPRWYQTIIAWYADGHYTLWYYMITIFTNNGISIVLKMEKYVQKRTVIKSCGWAICGPCKYLRHFRLVFLITPSLRTYSWSCPQITFIKALPTLICFRFKTHLFLSVLAFRTHWGNTLH